MYKKILVPLDGSKRAEAIMPHVEELAHRYGATAILLQVVDSTHMVAGPYGEIPDYQTYLDDLKNREEEAKQYLAGWQGILSAQDITAVAKVEMGAIVDGIMSVAERENADLIAMSSHGRTGLSRVFYGSVAAGLLHRTDRPLMLIRAATDG